MINRFLRRLTVHGRITGWFSVLLLLLALTFPLVMVSNLLLVNRVRQVAEIETRADRLLLLASARIESSRVNLMRYVEDYAPSTYQALDDVNQADRLLVEAHDLIEDPEQREAVAEVFVEALDDYRALIGLVESARTGGSEQDISRSLFEAYRLGNNIGQRIEQIVAASEKTVAAANETIYHSVQTMLLIVGASYLITLVLGIVITARVRRSITDPVNELHRAAEAFRAGQLDMAIPVVGTDELSVLAQTFNQMAQQLRDLIGSLEQRVAERTRALERRTVQLEAAARVARDASEIRDVKELLDRVVHLISGRFGFYHAGIFVLDDMGEYAVLQAASSEGGQRMLARGHRLAVGKVGIVGYVAGTGKPRIALDVGADAVFFDNPDLPLTRSEMALPLKVGERVIGVLDVQSEEPAAFTDEDVAVLQTMADQIALAIENAHLLGESRQMLRELERVYGERARAAWAEYARHLPAFRYTGTGVEPAPLSGSPTPTAGNGHQLSIPIRLHGETIGSILLQRESEADPWSPEDAVMAEEIGVQIGLALENARLLAEMERRAEREQMLGEITARLTRSLDMKALLRAAVEELARLPEVTEVAVYLGSGEDGAEA